jgi:hypothetical protein
LTKFTIVSSASANNRGSLVNLVVNNASKCLSHVPEEALRLLSSLICCASGLLRSKDRRVSAAVAGGVLTVAVTLGKVDVCVRSNHDNRVVCRVGTDTGALESIDFLGGINCDIGAFRA